MSEYTKGPWEILDHDARRLLIMPSNPDCGCVAECYEYSGGDEPETSRANAHLIAASPDLYQALKQLVHLHMCEMEGIESGMPTYKDWMGAVEKAEEAINKAENGNL